MLKALKMNLVLHIVSHLQDEDFTCYQKLQPPTTDKERRLYRLIKKYHDLFSDLQEYFDAEDQKVNVLKLTYEERVDSSGNITKANEYIADASKKQASLSEECADLAEEFRVKFNNMLEVSKELMNECNATTDIINLSRSNITQHLEESRKTQDLLMHIAEQISNLTGNMKSIGSILNLIKKISQQTNILAINAQIEAVHTGAAGAGFSVIAREIKSLANESKKASDKISETIGHVIREVSLVSQTALSGKALAVSQSQSIASVDEVMNKMGQAINHLIEQQSRSFDLIQELDSANNRMISGISDIVMEAQKSAATCQVVADVSLEQSKQDADFQQMIQSLQIFNRSNADMLKNVKTLQGTDAKQKIGILCLEQGEFYREIEKAAILAGEKLNIQVVSKTPVKFDIEKQLSAFNELVEQKVNGIVVVPGDADRFRPLLHQARGKGIKVVCIDADVLGERDVYVTSDNFEGGRLAGKAAANALNGQGRIYVLLCASEVSNVLQRLEGFREEIQKFKDISIIKIIKQKDTDQNITEQLLREIAAESTEFDLLYLATAESGEIASNLWSENHLTNRLVVLSKSNKVTTAVAQGIVSAQIVQNNKQWGELAVQRLADLFQKKSVSEYEDTGMYEINSNNFIIFQGK